MKIKKRIVKLLPFFIPIFIFSIALLAFYPGIMSYDSHVQWGQVQSGAITDGHPFLTTFVMLLLSKIYKIQIKVLHFYKFIVIILL